jgi:hypothetical protein
MHLWAKVYQYSFVFQERIKAWQQWQNATSALTKKREAKAKAELVGKAERVGQLRQEIAEQERQQEMAQGRSGKRLL